MCGKVRISLVEVKKAEYGLMLFGLLKSPKGLADAFYGCEKVDKRSCLRFIHILKKVHL